MFGFPRQGSERGESSTGKKINNILHINEIYMKKQKVKDAGCERPHTLAHTLG